MCQLRAWPSSNSYEFSYLLPFKKSLGTRKTSKMRLLIFEKALQIKGCKDSKILYVFISKQQYENIFNEKTAFRINLDVMFNKYIEFSNCFKI